jgi:hypothetical protein
LSKQVHTWNKNRPEGIGKRTCALDVLDELFQARLNHHNRLGRDIQADHVTDQIDAILRP